MARRRKRLEQMTERERLVMVCGVSLGKWDREHGYYLQSPEAFSRSVEEWLDGDKVAGAAFDKAGWSFKQFVRDARPYYVRHHGAGEGKV